MRYRYTVFSTEIPAQGSPPLTMPEGTRIVAVLKKAPSSTAAERWDLLVEEEIPI